jgi:hypothetical protein
MQRRLALFWAVRELAGFRSRLAVSLQPSPPKQLAGGGGDKINLPLQCLPGLRMELDTRIGTGKVAWIGNGSGVINVTKLASHLLIQTILASKHTPRPGEPRTTVRMTTHSPLEFRGNWPLNDNARPKLGLPGQLLRRARVQTPPTSALNRLNTTSPHDETR